MLAQTTRIIIHGINTINHNIANTQSHQEIKFFTSSNCIFKVKSEDNHFNKEFNIHEHGHKIVKKTHRFLNHVHLNFFQFFHIFKELYNKKPQQLIK